MNRSTVSHLLKKDKPYHPDFDPKAEPLVRASDEGNLKKVRALVKAGVPVNAISHKRWGYYPIHAAAEKGHDTVVSFLLTVGARPDVRTAAEHEQQQNTPMILAAWAGHTKIVQILVEAGADIDAFSLQNNTPLTAAILTGNRTLFDFLIAHGSHPKPAHFRLAVGKGDTALCDWFLKQGFDVNKNEEEESMSLLYKAIGTTTANQMEMVRFLVEHGANVNRPAGSFGEPPLVQAALHGKREIVAFLLERGADPNLPSIHKAYALNYSSRRGDVENVEALVHAGAKINSVDFEKMTPIEWAIQNKDKDMVQLLLKHGAEIPKELMATAVRRFGKQSLSNSQNSAEGCSASR